MKTIIAVEFCVGEMVVIPELDNCNAIIEQINFGKSGVAYQAAWFHNGDRKTAWLNSKEIREQQ
jgi:hypothetical protein